jgi:hypothetical protein
MKMAKATEPLIRAFFCKLIIKHQALGLDYKTPNPGP